MKILICEKNKDRIQLEIAKMRGNETSRIIGYEDLLRTAEVATKKADKLLVKHRKGLRYVLCLNERMPAAYKYKYSADRAILDYGPKGWYLVDIKRNEYWPSTPNQSFFDWIFDSLEEIVEMRKQVSLYLLEKFCEV